MDETTKLAAARRYAPPLLVAGAVDRRGARLRQLNRKAFQYVRNAQMGFEDVYPGSSAIVRRAAPPPGTAAAASFLRSTGLPEGYVYPAPEIAGEAPSGHWRLSWAAAGATVGALLLGPWGLALGGGFGALAGRR